MYQSKNVGCLYAKHNKTFKEIFYDMNNSVWKLGNILKDFKYKEETQNSYAFSSVENMFFIHLYKLLAYTRDIGRNGRGERNNTYTQLAIWNKYFPALAKSAITELVRNYGCWRDIRQFCNYYMDYKKIPLTTRSLPDIVEHCIKLISNQITLDNCISDAPISNASKWCPREKNKKFGWLFTHIVRSYFGTSTLEYSDCKKFRHILSRLNRYNKVAQVNFCEKTWSKIDMDVLSCKTYSKNKVAIHNGDNSNDRLCCAEQFFFYGNQYNSPCKPLPYLHLMGLFRAELINKVINLYNFNMRNQSQFRIIDHIWKCNWEKERSELNDIIPVIETSNAMINCDTESNTAFINALTISATILKQQNNVRQNNGYRIGPEKLVDTLLCSYSKYEESGAFKELEAAHDDSITSVLTKLVGGLKPNFNTTADGLCVKERKSFDFSKFYDLFLMKLVYEKHHPDIANRKTLLFLCSEVDTKRLERKIKKKYDRCVMNYHRTGIQLTGFPYRPPKIIVWNMASSASELPISGGFNMGEKNKDSVTIIDCKSDSRHNGFANFAERFLAIGNVDHECFNNIALNLNYYDDDFNPFCV